MIITPPDAEACVAYVVEQSSTTNDSWIWITFNWIDENAHGWDDLPAQSRCEWLAEHLLPELIGHVAECRELGGCMEDLPLVEQILAVLRSCRRIPDDSPADVAATVRDAVDFGPLFEVRAYLTALETLRGWRGDQRRYGWNFFAWALGRDRSAFEWWTARDWDDIPEHLNSVEERIRGAVAHPLLADGSARGVPQCGEYHVETPDADVLGPMVTATDAARIFKAMRDANIMVATWDEIAGFLGASSGKALAALASKPNSASPRVVRMLELLLAQCHPDECDELLRRLR